MDSFSPTPIPIIQAVLKKAGVGPGTKFVDLGSGDGRVIREALKLGADAYGVEINEELARKSNSYMIPSVTKVGDMRNESLADIDVAACFCWENEEVVANAEREMKYGSRLILVGHYMELEPLEYEEYQFSIWSQKI